MKVMCRFRPLNENEKSKTGDQTVCEFHGSKRSVTLTLAKTKQSDSMVGTNKFTFDRVFDPETSQREV